jgi:hypothetical protein
MSDQLAKRWVRWLTAQHLPLDHIARILDLDVAAVEELAVWNGRGIAPRIDGPPRFRGAENIRGEAGTKVRRLDALAYRPSRIATILALDPSAVRDFLRRYRPLRKPKSGAELTRPRSRPEQRRAMATLRRRKDRRRRLEAARDTEWGYRGRAGDAVDAEPVPLTPSVEVEPAIAPELVELPAPAATELLSDEEWEPHWGISRSRSARGSRNPRAKLDNARAAEIRELKAQGMTMAALAARFGVSMATIGRITSGRSYTDPPTDSLDGSIDPPPPSPAAPAAPSERYDQPRVCEDWTSRDETASADIRADRAAALAVELSRAPAIAGPPAVEDLRQDEEEWPSLCGRPPILDDTAAGRAIELRAAGLRWSEIGRRLGVSGQTAKAAAVRAGLSLWRSGIDHEALREALYRALPTCPALRQLLGID